MAVREVSAEAEDTQTKLAPSRSRGRDETQKYVDSKVKSLVGDWESAGKPDKAIPNVRIAVDDKAEGKRRVNRAFSLASKGREDKLTLGPRWFEDSKPDAEGWVTLKFGVRVIPRSEKPEAETAETPAETAETPAKTAETPAETADEGGDQPQTGQPEQSGRRGFGRR